MPTGEYDGSMAWRNPATWGPLGMGCCLCHDNPPIIMRFCLSCLVRLLGWSAHQVTLWLGVQEKAYTRQEARKDALRRWENYDPSGIIEYAEAYGVWLIDQHNILHPTALMKA